MRDLRERYKNKVTRSCVAFFFFLYLVDDRYMYPWVDGHDLYCTCMVYEKEQYMRMAIHAERGTPCDGEQHSVVSCAACATR